MIKNMKIKSSLILGFGVTVVISAVIIIASLFMMSSQKDNFNSVLNEEVRANAVVRQSRLDGYTAMVDAYNMLINPNSSENAARAANANAALNEMSTLLQELSTVYTLNDGLDNQYIQAANEYQGDLAQLLTYINAGRTDEAVTWIQNEVGPSLSNMGDLAAQMNSNIAAAQQEIIARDNLISTIMMIIILVAMVIAVIVVLSLALSIIKNIVVPTQEVHNALVGFSEGKLSIPVHFESKNELGEMCDALRRSQSILGGVIADECELLAKMASGDFNVKSRDTSLYVGELRMIIESLREIKQKLSSVLTQIHQAAEQVSTGSDQVSSGAQALSQGATEQASSVQELAATISTISSQIASNAESAQRTSKLANEVGGEINRANEQMLAMNGAMDDINKKSQEIGKIIKTIEDIAFQTNILALNAAVEAARAGAAGKGFAVVANEVRNLASKSAEASKDTSALIETSMKAVENGNQLATETAQSLARVVQSASEITGVIDQIADASQQQADAVVQITQGMDQISSVVQTNSATAEESAAASEELSGQANMLKELVGQFTLEEISDAALSDAIVYRSSPSSFDSEKY